MKIVLEISDDNLRHAIETQVGKAVAQLTTEVINAELDKIISSKFERVNDASIEKAIGIAASELVKSGSHGYQLTARVDKALSAAARELVRECSRNL